MRIIGTFIVTGVNWPRDDFQVAKPKPASKAARGKSCVREACECAAHLKRAQTAHQAKGAAFCRPRAAP